MLIFRKISREEEGEEVVVDSLGNKGIWLDLEEKYLQDGDKHEDKIWERRFVGFGVWRQGYYVIRENKIGWVTERELELRDICEFDGELKMWHLRGEGPKQCWVTSIRVLRGNEFRSNFLVGEKKEVRICELQKDDIEWVGFSTIRAWNGKFWTMAAEIKRQGKRCFIASGNYKRGDYCLERKKIWDGTSWIEADHVTRNGKYIPIIPGEFKEGDCRDEHIGSKTIQYIWKGAKWVQQFRILRFTDQEDTSLTEEQFAEAVRMCAGVVYYSGRNPGPPQESMMTQEDLLPGDVLEGENKVWSGSEWVELLHIQRGDFEFSFVREQLSPDDVLVRENKVWDGEDWTRGFEIQRGNQKQIVRRERLEAEDVLLDTGEVWSGSEWVEGIRIVHKIHDYGFQERVILPSKLQRGDVSFDGGYEVWDGESWVRGDRIERNKQKRVVSLDDLKPGDINENGNTPKNMGKVWTQGRWGLPFKVLRKGRSKKVIQERLKIGDTINDEVWDGNSWIKGDIVIRGGHSTVILPGAFEEGDLSQLKVWNGSSWVRDEWLYCGEPEALAGTLYGTWAVTSSGQGVTDSRDESPEVSEQTVQQEEVSGGVVLELGTEPVRRDDTEGSAPGPGVPPIVMGVKSLVYDEEGREYEMVTTSDPRTGDHVIDIVPSTVLHLSSVPADSGQSWFGGARRPPPHYGGGGGNGYSSCAHVPKYPDTFNLPLGGKSSNDTDDEDGITS